MNVPYNGKLLRLGSVGKPVLAVERALTKAGYAGFRTDKLYGPATMQAVKRFQEDHHLSVDGKVGPVTLRALSPFFDEYGYWLYTGRKPGVQTLQLLAVFVPTHETAGLPGFPAIDLFAQPATQVLPPEAGEVVNPHMIEWDLAKRVGGMTCYYQGAESGDTYFLTHFGVLVPGGSYGRGHTIGNVGAVPHGWWAPHIHEGKHRGRYDPE